MLAHQSFGNLHQNPYPINYTQNNQNFSGYFPQNSENLPVLDTNYENEDFSQRAIEVQAPGLFPNNSVPYEFGVSRIEAKSSPKIIDLLAGNQNADVGALQKQMKKSMTVYKVSDWVTEVLYSRNKYKFLIRLAANTSEIKK